MQGPLRRYSVQPHITKFLISTMWATLVQLIFTKMKTYHKLTFEDSVSSHVYFLFLETETRHSRKILYFHNLYQQLY